MPVLTDVAHALASGRIDVVDLTAPLTPDTPILQLPEPYANTIPFQLEEISRYDERGPAWYWNNIHTGEHTGTHFDAPIHWATGAGGRDISTVPTSELVAPAVVVDHSADAANNPDFLLEVDHLNHWQDQHGPFPSGAWLLLRTGWDEHSTDPAAFSNTDEHGSHTPGVSAECARWIAHETDLLGLGVETVGTDAGMAPHLDPPFPCHNYLHGAGKYGLTQLQNLARLPATGAIVIAAPLPIVGGSGSPSRVLALVENPA